MDRSAKIYITGHSGMTGMALVRMLTERGYTNIITRTHKELDLRSQQEVGLFFEKERPDYVFHLAARTHTIVGVTTFPADYLYDNAMMTLNVIHSAQENGCKKLLYVGSYNVYPGKTPQPMREADLFASPFGNPPDGYTLAKILGLRYCELTNLQNKTEFISVTPATLYGPGDNFHPENSRVVAAMMRRFHDAKINGLPRVTCWGDGSPLREFLYVDDFADCCIFLMDRYSGNEAINAGTGEGVSIQSLAQAIAKVVGFTGEICWDTSKPNGVPCKLLDNTKTTSLEWICKTPLDLGLQKTYSWFLENIV